MKQDGLPLTRRRLLAGCGTIGAAGTLGGTGTLVLLNREKSSTQSGERSTEEDSAIDPQMDVELRTWYNGQSQTNRALDDSPLPIFTVPPDDDVLPGDYGEASISVTVTRGSGSIRLGGELRSNAENGLVESERTVDTSGEDPGDGNGELADAIRATVWRDRIGDRTVDDDERVLASGSLEQVLSKLNGGIPLEGDLSSSTKKCFEEDATFFIGVKWELPEDIGNAVQSDSVAFDLGFHVQQCRETVVGNPFSRSR